jgi:hypothetical protein
MTDEIAGLERVLEWYSHKDETFVGESPLKPCRLSELQACWDVPPDDPMFEIYPVGPAQLDWIRAQVNVPVDLREYDYFLASYVTDPADSAKLGARFGLFPAPRRLPAFPDATRSKPKSPSKRKRR